MDTSGWLCSSDGRYLDTTEDPRSLGPPPGITVDMTFTGKWHGFFSAMWRERSGAWGSAAVLARGSSTDKNAHPSQKRVC